MMHHVKDERFDRGTDILPHMCPTEVVVEDRNDGNAQEEVMASKDIY